MTRTLHSLIFFLISYTCVAQPGTNKLHHAQRALTNVIVHDIFSPPVASRIYLYSSIAAYEALNITVEDGGFRQIRHDFPLLSGRPSKTLVHSEWASLYAFLFTASRMVFSDSAMLDSLRILLRDVEKDPRYPASVQWGKRVSDSVISWSKGDGYWETRKWRRYSLIRNPSAWKPTPPGYIAAVEPYWGRMRCMVLDSLDKFRPALPITFSTDTVSRFYAQAKEVYAISKVMSREDSLKALFWDCNPFFINTQGHLSFATKKLSPGGHWMSIAGIAAQVSGAGFAKAVNGYLFTAIALYDAFISCWDEKYRSNLIRPETYINAHIDESWRPLLQTPPFPEYTSGHSVISAAAAVVLSHLFGADFAFDDYTETGYGLPVRHFSSFEEAAIEAGISRFLGGIHYRAAVENGFIQGRKIGNEVVKIVYLQSRLNKRSLEVE